MTCTTYESTVGNPNRTMRFPITLCRNLPRKCRKLICKNIVEKNPTDDLGRTPISVARASRNMDIVSFLETFDIFSRLLKLSK